MKGTEKQVKFAQDIIKNIVEIHEKDMAYIPKMANKQEQAKADHEFVISWFKGQDDAAFVINNFKNTLNTNNPGEIKAIIREYLQNNKIYTISLRASNELARAMRA